MSRYLIPEEAQEKFGITPKNITPLGVRTGLPEEYGTPMYFVATDFDGEVLCEDHAEMVAPQMSDLGMILKAVAHKQNNLFLPFSDSFDMLNDILQKEKKSSGIHTKNQKQPLKSTEKSLIIKSEDGGQGSGNFGHAGVKGQVGGSASSSKASGESEPVSACGANAFKVKGFTDKQKLNNHWKNGRAHKEEYADDGIITKEQYEQRAVELIQMPCSNGIKGYKTKDGKLCRYDVNKNDYVTGRPTKGVYTMFKPKDKESYFQKMFEAEGVIDDE